MYKVLTKAVNIRREGHPLSWRVVGYDLHKILPKAVSLTNPPDGGPRTTFRGWYDE